jgi:hypothetical protein
LTPHRSRRARPAVTPEDILAVHEEPIVTLAQKLRALVRAELPDAEERAYPGWKAIGYVDADAGYVCGIFPFSDRVALGFERGVLLPDPEGLLRPGVSGGSKVRYVEIRRPSDVRVHALRALLRAALTVARR